MLEELYNSSKEDRKNRRLQRWRADEAGQTGHSINLRILRDDEAVGYIMAQDEEEATWLKGVLNRERELPSPEKKD